MPSSSIIVQAPPQRVWEMVSDVTRVGEWSPETVGAEWLDGATGPAVGARFKGHNKRKWKWSSTCTVTEAEPGRSFVFEVGKGETRWSYTMKPVDGGCEVVESFEILRPPGPVGRWSYRPSTGVKWADREADLVHGMEETLRRLKVAAEAPSADSA